MVTEAPLALVVDRLQFFKLLAASVNPDGQPDEVSERQLLDRLLDFLNPAHTCRAGSKDLPQPQLWAALGLVILKPPPVRASE